MKSQENAGTVPGQSCENFVYVFCCFLFFFFLALILCLDRQGLNLDVLDLHVSGSGLNPARQVLCGEVMPVLHDLCKHLSSVLGWAAL